MEQKSLSRELGLREAVALNMIDMVGIGPFIVMPLVIQYMGGPQSFLAWIAGALLSLVDGCIWSELGAAMPQAGEAASSCGKSTAGSGGENSCRFSSSGRRVFRRRW